MTRVGRIGSRVSGDRWSALRRPPLGLAIGVVSALALTAAVAPFRDSVSRASPALMLVVPVVVAGILGGRLPALCTAVVADVAYSVVFIPPVGSLDVALSADVVALVVFLVVAVLVGTLAANEAGRRRSAERRSRQLEAMHQRLQAVTAERESLADEHNRRLVLERVDEQRAALLRSVSHDLRTPLAAIQAVATDLREDIGYDPDTRRRLLDVVVGQAQRLDRLVADLLSLGRIEAGALQLVRQSVDPAELITETVDPLRPLFTGTDIAVELAAELDRVEVDYTQIQQVVTNLVDNAVRHSPPTATVTVAAMPAAGGVDITVTDQGAGVDPEEEALIFEPFRTGAASGSTGVGLAICKGIVEAHGGRIDVGPAPGGGPGSASSSLLPPMLPAEVIPRPARPERVMVVEDDPTMAEILTVSLGARGYLVISAADGHSALEQASTMDPAVIILDLGLPDLDGLEVCRRLRGISRASIIVVTADGSEGRKIAALDQGADDYVTKPFSLPELLARLRVAVRHSRVTHPVVDDTVTEVGSLRFDHAHHRSTLGDEVLVLTPKEYALLALLAEHAGRIITHRVLLERVWGPGSVGRTEYLRTYTNQLRKKLGDDVRSPRLVTVPGVGYQLTAPAEDGATDDGAGDGATDGDVAGDRR